MKKKISRILGVGLSLALLTGLVAGLVPALAVDDHIYDLQFGVPKQPGNTSQIAISVLKPPLSGTAHVVDMAVTADGSLTYMVAGAYQDLIYTANRLYKSEYGGYMWTPKKIADEDGVDLIAAGASDSIDLVAVATDDPDLVVVADADTPEVFVSQDGGATWVSLGVPDAGDLVTEAKTLYCLDINREFSGKRYIAVGGIDTLDNAGLWYIDLTGVPTTWLNAMETTDGWDAAGAYDWAEAVWAAEFSPNFPADRTMVVVTGPTGQYAGYEFYEFQEGSGGGTAELSSAERYSKEYSAYLSDGGTGFDTNPNYYGRVVIPDVNIPLANLLTPGDLSYYFNYNDPVTAYPDAFPYMILEIDSAGGTSPDGWIVLLSGGESYQPAQNTWVQWDIDEWDSWHGAGTASGVALGSDLATFSGALGGASVVDVKVAVGEWHKGTYTPITGYVDDIHIEGTTYDLEPAPDVRLQLASFDAKEWNDGFAPFGADWDAVEVEAIAAGQAALAASISLPDDYLASDESTRVAFVGLATDDGTYTGNAYRFDDYKRTRILGELDPYQEPIKSVAYNTDADKLVIGKWLDNNVLRSANPLANEPDVYDSKSVKRPGLNCGTDQLIVMWAGNNVIAGSSGSDSAYSVSSDDGKTFDDLSFVNDWAYTIEDIAFTSTGTCYMLTDDGANLSVWRGRDISENFWIRVLTLCGEQGYIVRTAPDDPATVLVAKLNDHTMYYSADSGATWAPRYCGVTLVDIAVESAEVFYALDAAGKVSKSEDAAFVWSSPAADSKCTSGATITSIGVDQVLVGSRGGKVSYSKDGNESWSGITPSIPSGKVQVAASGLETGNSVYAASDAANSGIWRFTFGTNDAVWTQITAANYLWYDYDGDHTALAPDVDASEGFGVAGLVLAADGTLYALAYCNDPDGDGAPVPGDQYGTPLPAMPYTYDSGSMLVRCLTPYYPEDIVPYTWDIPVITKADFTLWAGDYDADDQVDANEWRPHNLIVTDSNKLWAVDRDWLDANPLFLNAIEEPSAEEQPAAYTIWLFRMDEMYLFTDTLTAAGPTLLGPSTDGTVAVNVMTGVGYPVVFSWEQLSRATSYKLYLAYDEAFTQNALTDGSYETVPNQLLLSTVVKTIDLDFVPGTTYYWRVKASAPLGSPYSEKRTFTVGTIVEEEVEPPALEPEVSGPAFGADGVSTKPTFTWAAIAGATYEFVLAEELGLDDPFEIIDYSATCDINAHVAREELKFSTTYHWRVRAVTADATSEWVRGLFTTEAAPPEPVEPTPPVIIEEKPAPEIILQVPATPAPVQVIPDWALYTIIVVGAVLVISVIVLIVRTRRVV